MSRLAEARNVLLLYLGTCRWASLAVGRSVCYPKWQKMTSARVVESLAAHSCQIFDLVQVEEARYSFFSLSYRK